VPLSTATTLRKVAELKFAGLMLAGLLAHATSSVQAGPNWQALHERLAAVQSSQGVPAMGLIIMDQGQPAFVAATGRGVTTVSPFRWGSISKTVTALTMLQLLAAQGVPLTDPVASHLPEPLPEPLPETLPEPFPEALYENPWEAEQPLCLVHLLELTAGLPDLSASEFNDNTPLPLRDALARGAEQRQLLWPPGLQHSYSNVPPGIAAAVIEKLSGLSYEDAVTQLVLAPLDMRGAGFEQTDALPGGFRLDGKTEIPYWNMTFRAFGGFNASLDSMARLLEALLNEGRLDDRQVLDPGTVSRLFRAESSLGARAGLAVTYGAGLYGWVNKGYLFYGHGGDADGYRSRLGLLPRAGRGYLLVINSDNPEALRQLQQHVETALTADLPGPVVPAPAAVSPQTLSILTGTYYPASARFQINRWQSGGQPSADIEIDGGELIFVKGSRRQRLIPMGQNRFRRPGEPVVSAVFVSYEGRLYLQGELGNFVRAGPDGCPGFIPGCDS
jgi:CubicO group peptidase (beta-lactamase class C family)